DGDVIFALSTSDPGDQVSVRRIDSDTGKVSTLFTSEGLGGLAVGPHDEVVASWSRWSTGKVGLSRFDPNTGHETVLFSKPASIYEGSGPVAVAADGDVIFALTGNFGVMSTVRRYDADTGKTSQLFSAEGVFDSLAVKPNGSVVGGYTHWGFNTAQDT